MIERSKCQASIGDVPDPRFQQEGYDLIAAAFEVYDELGPGFLEEIYQEAIEWELKRREIPWTSKPVLRVHYKCEPLTKFYVPDLIIHGRVLVELKAAKTLAPEHEAQLFNYLKATRLPVGYLINFGSHPKLEWRRFVVRPPSSAD